MREIERLNKQELAAGVPIEASWHNDYNDTAYIYFGGLPPELNEGDVLTVFSQYGVPVHVRLVRHKDTGKSQGFGFLKYEDQRSTILAVDNLNGISVLGRTLRVDHTYFKPRDDEDPAQLESEMKFDDYLADEVEQDEKKEHRRRQRRHHRHRSRSPASRGSSSRALKTADDLEKESEDPMAAYFRDREKHKGRV